MSPSPIILHRADQVELHQMKLPGEPRLLWLEAWLDNLDLHAVLAIVVVLIVVNIVWLARELSRDIARTKGANRA